MKVNFVIPSTVLGGGIRIVFTYANYLVSQGHDVVVYVPCLYAWPDIENGKINVKTSLANTFKRGTKVNWFDNHFQIKLAFKISDTYIRDADVTIATAWYTARAVYNLSDTKGKKVYFVQDYEIWHQIKEDVDNSYRLDMTRICITRTLADKIYTECGVKSEVVYNGINDEEFMSDEKKMNTPKTIIMLGNFADYKGGKKGLEILCDIKKKYGTRIIIFGISKPKFIPDDIEYYVLPERNKLISLYRESDILLFPSLQEAWGLSVLEAMANKTAVVGMKAGCLQEIGVDGENCLLADLNFEELQEKLEYLLENDDLIRRLQDKGYATANGFRWSESFEKFEKLLIE